jgi:uncharacterized protein YfkK (UPF0435 family)
MEYCPSDENLELAVRAIARKLKVFSADDLHVLDFSVEKLGRNRSVYGSILRNLCNQGFIRKRGYILSERSVSHNRPILQWECLER